MEPATKRRKERAKAFCALLAASLALACATPVCAQTYDTSKEMMMVDMEKRYIDAGSDIAPEQTIYFIIYNERYLCNKRYFKFDCRVSEGREVIDSIKLVEKPISDIQGGPSRRAHYVEVKLKEHLRDEDIRLEFTLEFTATKAGGEAHISFGLPDPIDVMEGDVILQRGRAWVTNDEVRGNRMAAGASGVLKPSRNDDNDVVWEDAKGELASLRFYGDSEGMRYFPKLSTSWGRSPYADQFADQDAYLFDFLGNPAIPSSGRPTLTIRNPFEGREDALSKGAGKAVVQQITEDGLVDVSGLFSLSADIRGYRFTSRPTQLGAYIFTFEETPPAVQGR